MTLNNLKKKRVSSKTSWTDEWYFDFAKTPRGERKIVFSGGIAKREVYEKRWREGMVFELA